YVRPIFASVKSCSGLGSAFGLPFEDIFGDCRTQAAPATIERSRSEVTERLMELSFPACASESAGDVQRARVGEWGGQDSPSRTTLQSLSFADGPARLVAGLGGCRNPRLYRRRAAASRSTLRTM